MKISGKRVNDSLCINAIWILVTFCRKLVGSSLSQHTMIPCKVSHPTQVIAVCVDQLGNFYVSVSLAYSPLSSRQRYYLAIMYVQLETSERYQHEWTYLRNRRTKLRTIWISDGNVHDLRSLSAWPGNEKCLEYCKKKEQKIRNLPFLRSHWMKFSIP